MRAECEGEGLGSGEGEGLGPGEGEDLGSGVRVRAKVQARAGPGSLLLADELAVIHLRPVVVAQHVAAPAIHPERPLTCLWG